MEDINSQGLNDASKSPDEVQDIHNPAIESGPINDRYERFDELANRLKEMGDSPWSLLDDHLLDELIHEDETSYDAEDLDLISSLRNLQLFSIMNREESTSEDFNDSEDLLDDDVPIHEFERATVLGRFELREIIGRGSFGIVYCAFDRVTRREVALKLPRPELRGLKTVKERFYREAASMSNLVHPGLVPLLDIGVTEGMPYLVSRLVNGPSLEHWLELTVRPISPRLAALWMKQLAEAIDHLHTQNILHCDIKPSNILLEHPYFETPLELAPEHLAIRVTDFGSASRIRSEKNARSNDMQGTLCFMAPEQIQAHGQIDARTDVYAISAILYEILTDKPVFDQTEPTQMKDDIIQKIPVKPRKLRPELPASLEAITLKGLAKVPENRYQSAGELAHDLDAWLNYKTPTVMKRDTIHRASLFLRRNRLVASIFFLMAIGAVTSMILRNQQNQILHQLEVERARLIWWNNYVGSMETAQKYKQSNNKDRLNEILNATQFWPKEVERHDDPREFSWYFLNQARVEMSQLVQDLPVNISFNLMAVAPLKKTIWLGGDDGTIREIDPKQLKVVQTLNVSNHGQVESIAISPNNQFMAIGYGSGKILLYNHDNLKLIASERYHSGLVRSMVFSNDSRVLISSGFDGQLIMKDLDSGSRQTYQSDSNNTQNRPAKLMGLAMLPDSKSVAVCSQDHRIHIIDIATAKLTRSLSGHFDEVEQAIVSTNGNYLISASKDRTIGIWDLKTMELRNQISMDNNLGQFNSANQSGLRIQQFSSFSNIAGMNAVAIDSGSGLIDIFGIPSGSRIGQMHGHTKGVWSLALLPWNNQIASIGRDFQMRIWEQPCRDLIPNILYFELKNHPDGTDTLFLSDDVTDRSQTLVGNQNVRSFKSKMEGEYKVSATAFGQKYLGVIQNQIQDSPNGQLTQTFKFSDNVMNSEPEDSNKPIKWKQVISFPIKFRKTVPILHGHPGMPYFLAIDGDQNLYFIDLSGNQSPKSILISSKVNDASFCPEKDEILVLKADSSNHALWNYKIGEWGRSLKSLINNNSEIQTEWVTLKYSPDNSHIAIYTIGGKLLIFNQATFELEKTIHLPEIGQRRVRHIVWTRDSKQILIAMSIKDMFLIDYETGKSLLRWDFGYRSIHKVEFSSNGESLWVLEGATEFDRIQSFQRRVFRFYAPRKPMPTTIPQP